MRNSKIQKIKNLLQGNVLAKSNKLTIEVPDDEEGIQSQKFNKNSPTYSKASAENQKAQPPIYLSKPKSSSTVKNAKKCYGDIGSPRISTKVFKFPPTQKISKRSARALNQSTHRNKSKGLTPVSKVTSTPTHRIMLEDNKKRPKTATNNEKNNLKAETGSSPNLNSIVTQVKVTTTHISSTLSDKEIQERSEILYKEHLFQTFQALKFVRSLQPVNLEQLKERRANLPVRKGWEGKKTLIFDLDETLVHCCEDITTSKPMVTLPIVFPTGETVQAGINIRPFAIECLQEVNKDFEVFVFTASHPCYANVVLDYLDPKKELIHQRFFRDSCINMGGVFIKDLRIFGNRNLKDMIIVDNAAYSFAYQLDNGIPIISWHDDPYDRELFNLMDYVKTLAAVEDIRDINEQTFHLRNFYDDYINEFLTADTVNSPKSTNKK